MIVVTNEEQEELNKQGLKVCSSCHNKMRQHINYCFTCNAEYKEEINEC